MQTMAEEWIEEGKQIGLQEGRKEGRKEGRQEGQRAMILHILQRRFQPTEESVQSLAHQLAQIADEGVLLQLVDLALEVSRLPDFHAKFHGLLTKTPV